MALELRAARMDDASAVWWQAWTPRYCSLGRTRLIWCHRRHASQSKRGLRFSLKARAPSARYPA